MHIFLHWLFEIRFAVETLEFEDDSIQTSHYDSFATISNSLIAHGDLLLS